MEEKDMMEILRLLSEDLPPEGIQETKSKETHKGYDTIGYGYQWCVDRFNNVCGDKWGFEYEIIDKKTGRYSNGKEYFEITVCIGIWVVDKTNLRYGAGGHVAVLFGDALKGAMTNGFKKASAMWGVGAVAYRGQLDPDNLPLPTSGEVKPMTATDKVKDEFVSDPMKEIEKEIESFTDENLLQLYKDEMREKIVKGSLKVSKSQGEAIGIKIQEQFDFIKSLKVQNEKHT